MLKRWKRVNRKNRSKDSSERERDAYFGLTICLRRSMERARSAHVMATSHVCTLTPGGAHFIAYESKEKREKREKIVC